MKKLSVTSVFNEAVEADYSRPYVQRDYCWASEIGGAFVDRFLKMAGVQPTNPPNARSRRKFAAGHVWEYIIVDLFDRLNLLQDVQKECWFELPGTVRYKGKVDLMIGGVPDLSKGRVLHKDMGLPEAFTGFLQKMIVNPVEFPLSGVEVKSVSSFIMDRIEAVNKPQYHHASQAVMYATSMNLPYTLFYICRDDARLREFTILPNDERYYPLLEADAANFTGYMLRNEQPPVEALCVINEDGLWEKNWHIEYSSYLTMIYGYETPEAYRDDVDGYIGRWNRIIKRIMTDKKEITADNRKGIVEMQEFIKKYDGKTYLLKNVGALDWINHV